MEAPLSELVTFGEHTFRSGNQIVVDFNVAKQVRSEIEKPRGHRTPSLKADAVITYHIIALFAVSMQNIFISHTDWFESKTQIKGCLLPAFSFLEGAREINHNRYSWNRKK